MSEVSEKNRLRATRPGRAIVLVAFLLVAVLVGVVVHQVRGSAPSGTGSAQTAVPTDYPFGAGSVWRQDISRAPLDPRSPAMVEGLAQQIEPHYGGIAAFNVDQFTVSWYTAGPDQPTVDVAWDDCQGKGYTPDGLLGPGGQFTAVPIPPDARPASGSDGQLTVYSPSQDRLWEFWRAQRTDQGWSACWGGRIDDASSNAGHFSGYFGAAASGLALSAGSIWVDDARRGQIHHALGLALLAPAAWPRFSWPAQRTDGYDQGADAIPEGTRLRLDPSVDVDALDLTPLARMVAVAAQRYGFIVTDKAGAVNVGVQTGQPLESDPEFWNRQMAGVPSYRVLQNFPWRDLQVLPQDYGKPAAAAR